MVLLYTPKKQPKKQAHFYADIVDLDYQGLGVAKVDGKTWFIENALPHERVQVEIRENKRQYGIGRAINILQKNPQRQLPRCQHYTECGGCQSQHIPLALQRQSKQEALYRRLVKLQPDVQLMPLIGDEQWAYRRRVRLSIVYDAAKKCVQVGMRKKQSEQLVALSECAVLETRIAALLPALQSLCQRWSMPKMLGHIELVRADNGIAMLLRHRQTLAENDRTLLLNFAQSHQINLFVQDDDNVRLLWGEPPYYRLADGSQLAFDIRDFIQVNDNVNQQMIATALDWLALTATDHVLDLFCGMGNFTLPLSRLVKSAVGIEGVLAMVEKAKMNAERNHLSNVQFYQTDLDQSFDEQVWAKQKFNKILLDPPRTGAAFALNALCRLQAEKILYVSCNPATLVRDVEILQNYGYRLRQVAMVDMFPNTGHLESISLFEQQKG